jgi:excisionase family DNA binding protein
MCQSDLMTVREVAKQLRVDDSTVRRWIKRGTLAAIALPSGGSRPPYRIRRATYEALVSPADLIAK